MGYLSKQPQRFFEPPDSRLRLIAINAASSVGEVVPNEVTIGDRQGDEFREGGQG
jgi:hypothetical protein